MLQGTNEALFVPSGWHHSVENMEDTLSINHNWLNGYNIHWAWKHLQGEHKSAEQAIEDCRLNPANSMRVAKDIWYMNVLASATWVLYP